MKKALFFLMGIILSITSVHAQTQPGIKPLSIGDTVPDITFNNIINYQSTSAKFSDFKGKMIILDFWATWCPPCVKGLRSLDKLQQKFSGKIIIMPVNNGGFGDTEAKVRKFLVTNKDIQLPTIYDKEKVLYNVFPHKLIPHCVLINGNGIVIAITTSEHLTEDNINALLAGKPSKIPVKNDLMNNDPATPLIIPVSDIGKVKCESLITSFTPGITGLYQTKIQNDLYKLTVFNLSIPDLLMISLQKPFYYKNRIILENVSDSSKYFICNVKDQLAVDKWNQNNTFCYELILPAAAKKERFNYMAEDLKRYAKATLNLEIHFEKRSMKCLALVKQASEVQHKITAPKKQSFVSEISWKNAPVSKIIMSLSGALNDIPIIDNTHITHPINLQLQLETLKNKSALKAELRKNGFDLIPTEQVLDVIVFREIKD